MALLATILTPTTSVAAEPTDMVLVWNLNAVGAISNPPTGTPPGLGQPPPGSPIHLAMVQGAVYDAVNAIDGTRQPYFYGLSAPAGASKAAAAPDDSPASTACTQSHSDWFRTEPPRTTGSRSAQPRPRPCSPIGSATAGSAA